ncbi:MAG TPA: L-rhamnose mutarotase [Luteolibacter sp.]
MRLISAILSSVLLLGIPAGQAKEPQVAINAAPLKTGAQRHTHIVEIKADQVDTCKKLLAAPPAEAAALYKAANTRNMTYFYKELGGKHYVISYCEYVGSDFTGDIGRLASSEAMTEWGKALAETHVSPGQLDVEEVFYTEGAADVVPTPEKYSRIGMITGLKPEKEAEYRTLHSTAWPGVLKGIKDCHYRNFTIRLAELNGNLFLIGYLEYVGKDPAADAAAAKAIPVNKRWWKFTDACQQPLPAAAAKGEIWDGLEEIHHLD